MAKIKVKPRTLEIISCANNAAGDGVPGEKLVVDNVAFTFTHDRVTEIFFMDGSNTQFNVDQFKIKRVN